MTVSQRSLNSFERILFASALGIAILVIAVRVGAVVFLYFRR